MPASRRLPASGCLLFAFALLAADALTRLKVCAAGADLARLSPPSAPFGPACVRRAGTACRS